MPVGGPVPFLRSSFIRDQSALQARSTMGHEVEPTAYTEESLHSSASGTSRVDSQDHASQNSVLSTSTQPKPIEIQTALKAGLFWSWLAARGRARVVLDQDVCCKEFMRTLESDRPCMELPRKIFLQCRRVWNLGMSRDTCSRCRKA